jgi:ribosomal protein S18 acetylase RimI-like enzyme
MRVLSSRVGRSATPIRPFRMARDLAGLADLVEVCFEADLERTGSQIVAEMRAMASWGVTLQMLTLFGPPYRGLVWEEEGRLVGNLTTMRERTGAWSLSNIAVLPEARGRGIGGALIDAAIERLRGMGVHSITLQVRQDNELAIGMYERRGLDAVAWPTLGRGVQGTTPVRPAQRSDLAGVLEVLAEGRPESARLFEPVRTSEWQQGTWRAALRALSMGLRGQERITLVAPCDGLLSGVAWATVRMLGSSHDVGVVASRLGQHRVERPLLMALLAEIDGLPRRDLRAVISTSQPGVLEAMGDLGFEQLRVLDRMGLALS